MIHMEQRLAQTQTQRLMLTQKMQQAVQILQLSTLELEQYIQQELETNPVLEQADRTEDPIREEVSPGPSSTEDDVNDIDFDLDDFSERWKGLGKSERDFSINPDAAERRDFYEQSITREESLKSRLLAQLRLAATSPQQALIGERIIGDIDDRGYFTGSLEEIAKELSASESDVEAVLHLIQRFEPTGVGARDVVECLLLQAEVEYPDEPELRELVSNHLLELERGQIPRIARAMNTTPERIEQLKSMLARLNPWPGYEYDSSPPQYVVPDVIVEKDEETGEFRVYLSDEFTPQVRVSSNYLQLAKSKNLNSEEKKYLREKIESAKWLMRNIHQRQNTILRIAKAIVEVQHEFFEKGVEAIKPLTLQEIADKVGVHEATVSRATRGKYMQTPQGLFEMKYFFSPGLKNDSGENQSSKSVQMLIKRMIDEEDKSKPLSDQRIADLLREQGINIARRTVTKYRESLGILPTNLRKSYQDR
ncbi:MAG TPA: RNA polymerase factor sigma-54 [Candidatus Hydrogenedentes bacterium]|nr:RNA polymerase factor sigma-54 [Candidatus Hydrogenedentota bacterium]HOL77705.1 RNA polymerase factor sigma-54 [Candidatus Hydrogenedentota bacterium]HPO86828.1 RNA polymerase factor sigma-54 [Candidatus Hydrogenedentota bacterium]